MSRVSPLIVVLGRPEIDPGSRYGLPIQTLRNEPMSIPHLQTFGFNPDYQAVYDIAYRYARDELYELSAKMDDEDGFPQAQFRALAEHSRILRIGSGPTRI